MLLGVFVLLGAGVFFDVGVLLCAEAASVRIKINAAVRKMVFICIMTLRSWRLRRNRRQLAEWMSGFVGVSKI